MMLHLRLTAYFDAKRGHLLRYSGTSAVGVLVGQAVLRVCFDIFGWPGLVSNLVAFVVGTIPAYHLNRNWVWGRGGRSNIAGEVLPFWVVSLAGLALSSLAVGLTDGVTNNGWLITLASLAAFGSVWIAKFVVFDRVLFAADSDKSDDPEVADAQQPSDGLSAQGLR